MKMKRIGCLLLSVIMLLSNICVPAFAAETPTYESGNFSYQLDSSDNVIITGLSEAAGELTHIEIPETLDGKTVTTIKSKAFAKNSTVNEVTIPSSITTIETFVFQGCENLKTVNYNSNAIPQKYFTGAGIFENCPIEEVNLGAGITVLPDDLLAATTSSEITINSVEQLTSIGNNAFRNTINLNTLIFTNDNITEIKERVFENSSVETITGSNIKLNNKELELDNVVYIGGYAFSSMDIIEVTVPSTVTAIGALAFEDCSSLKTLNYNTSISPSLYFTGAGAFAGSPIEEVNLGSGVTVIPSIVAGITSSEIVINSEEELFKLNDNAFSNAPNLEKITFTNSNFTIIGSSVFQNSNKLVEIADNNIQLQDGILALNNIVSIGNNAFSSMSITEITIPSTVTSIGSLAFENCSNLETVNFNAFITPSSYFTGAGVFGGSPVKTVNLGAGITAIPNYFLGGTTSDKITVNSVDVINTIGLGTFAFNSNLSSVSIPNSNIVAINSKAFYNTGLTSYVIPASVLTIGSEAFANCSNLENVELLHEVAPTIENGAFYNMAVDSIIRVKNADVAAAFTNSNYTIENTTVKIGNEFHVTYKVDGNGTITRDGLTDTVIAAIIEDNSDLHSVVATPDAGSKFIHWIDASGQVVSTDNTLTVDMPEEDETYTAVFEKIPYTITFELDAKYGTLDNPVLTRYYGDYISNDEIVINMNPGYTFNGWLNNGVPAEITRVWGTTTYTADVTISKYEYNINVYYNGELHDVITHSDYVDTVITDYQQFTVPAYWKLDKVENCPLTISADTSLNNINVYYVLDTDNYGTYKVNYYYDDELGETLTYTVPLGTVVDRTILRDKSGYVFNSVEGLPMVVNDCNGEINMNYITDDNPEYTLTIEYYYNDVIDSSKTETIKLPKGTKFSELVAKVDYNTITGYEYKSLEYIIPEAHDGHLYRVEYYYDGVIDDSLTETDVELPNIDDKIVQNTKDGYVFVDMTQFSNIKIDVDGIKIKVKYETESYDPSDADYISFKVQYYYSDNRYTTDVSGARIDESQTDTITVPKGTIIKGIKNKTKNTHVLVEIKSVPMTIDKEGIVIKAYYLPIGNQIPGIDSRFEAEYPYTPDKPIPSLGDEFYTAIEENEEGESVIRIYYKSDTSEYIVNYYFDGVKDEALTEKETVLNGTVINTYIDKVKENYTFDRVIGLPLTVSKDGGNVINVYYTHKTADYSIEYYFDGIIDSSLTETDNVKVGTVISSYTDKIKPGYEFDKVVGSPLTVGTGSDNTIKVYYKSIPKYDYRVEYYYNDVLDETKTDVFTVVRNTTISTYADKSNGYELDKVIGLPLTVTDDAGVIKVYYKLEAAYSYEYYFDGIIDNSLTESKTVYVGTVISTYVDKVKENYELDRVDNLPLVVSASGDNIVRIYYKTIKVPYSVEYYFDGAIDDTLTETSTAAIGTIISTYQDKIKENYELDKVVGLPLTLSQDDNVIRVYYKTMKVDYTVEYYFDGVVDTSLTDSFNVNVGSVITTYTDKCKSGYSFDKVLGIPLTVSAASENTIKVYYEKNAPLMADYTIEYYYDGVKDAAKTEEGYVIVGTVISTYPDKSNGYELDKVIGLPLTTSLTSENTIQVFYKSVVDEYTVEYYFNGNKDSSLTDTYEAVVGSVISTYTDKCKPGYRFDKVENLPLTVAEDGENTIRVYYEKIPVIIIIPDVEYTIEYYFDGVIDNSLTDVKEAAPGTVIKYTPDKCKDGYEYDRTENLPLTVSKHGENVIRVYYKSIEVAPTEEIYTIEYYFNNVMDDSLTIHESAVVGTVISTYPDKCKEGFEFDKVENLPLTVIDDAENIIRVYYKEIVVAPVETTYKVNYFYNYNLEITETFKGVVGEKIETVDDKIRDGYRLEKIETLPLILKEQDNVINVYYVSEDSVQTGIPTGRVVTNVVAICLSSGILYFLLRKKRK